MKRTLCLILALLLATLTVVPAMAAVSEPSVTPRYSHIAQLYSGLTIGVLGISSCQASCYAETGDSVVLTAKLQRYDGSAWTTVKTWTVTGEHTASISKNYAVYSGYTYRLRVTCAVYDVSGTLLESGTCYSHQVEY